MRPAIDPMFNSIAKAYHERVMGVVLSGAGTDGAAGIVEIQDSVAAPLFRVLGRTMAVDAGGSHRSRRPGVYVHGNIAIRVTAFCSPGFLPTTFKSCSN